MRPLKLTFEAFGPYIEKTVIDFSLISDSSIFLITGPTGGGKTSILDAMCFALYCRATGGRRTFAEMRCAGASSDKPTLVEFDFSLNGKTYRFRRTQTVYIKRTTGLPETREEHECFEEAEGEYILLESGSETAVRKKAEELLGLSCEQFSQIITLPQGDFLRLLRASSRDKHKILETLFSGGLWESVTERFLRRVRSLEEGSARLSVSLNSLLEKEGAETAEGLSEMLEALKEQRDKAEKLSGEKQAQKAEEEKLFSHASEYFRLKKELDGKLIEETAAETRFKELELEFSMLPEKRDKIKEHQTRAQTVTGEIAASEELMKKLKNADSLKDALLKLTETREKLEASVSLLSESRKEIEGRLKVGREFEQKAQNASARLPELMEERQELEKKLEAYRNRESALEALKESENALSEALEKEKSARVIACAVTAQLKEQERLLSEDSALSLALTLSPGEPCPVCGSREHPCPARGDIHAPDPESVEALRKENETAQANMQKAAALLENAKADAAQKKTQAGELEDICLKLNISKEELTEKAAALDKEAELLSADSKKLPAARQRLSELERQNEDISEKLAESTASLAGANARAEELSSRIKDALSDCGDRDIKALENSIDESKKQRELISREIEKLTRECESAAADRSAALATYRAASSAREKAQKDFEEASKKPAPEGSPEDIKAELDAADAELSAVMQELGRISQQIISAEDTLKKSESILGELKSTDEKYRRAAKIYRSISGQNPLRVSLSLYVMSIMMEEVLDSANRFFSTLSRGRYALKLMEGSRNARALGGLDLEVLDGASMLPRSIETLSGGEQFLASLSLAFGLSDVVQRHSGAVSMDAIFIDEGFGSLDADTLDTAMKALSMIRAGGKLVGVISHVSELQNRIPVKIEVSRDSTGASLARLKLD